MNTMNTTRAFHAMAKPGGSQCNLRCDYCFYLEKSSLYPETKPQYNALACVNRRSALEPLLVYDFFRDAGIEFVQFIPVVERTAGLRETGHGLALHGPGNPEETVTEAPEWSVLPGDYGQFPTTIFDRWIKRDVGKMFVMNFEWALANYMGRPGTVCHHQPTCGRSVIIERNGDVYACDHYVYPEYYRGPRRTVNNSAAS